MSEILNDDNKITDSDRLIHTPSSFARKNLTYAQETGVLKSLKTHSCIRENLDSYLFFMVLEGAGKVSVGGKEYDASKGDIVFLDCKKRYVHTSSENKPWKIRWVHFNGQRPMALYSLFEESNNKCPVYTPKNGLDEYIAVFDRLEESLVSSNVLAEINQSHILEELITKCLNEVSLDKLFSIDNNERKLDSDDFHTLRESVNEHVGEEDLERILSIQYGLQPDALSDLFKQKYGISLTDYILNRKVNKVKELLRFTIKRIDEIAEESGIGDESRLRQIFMESEEMSPEDYRKKWAQWIKS